MSSPMTKRILYGAIMIAVLAGLFYLDSWVREGPLTAAVLLILVLLGSRELARIAEGSGLKLLATSGMLGTALVAMSPYWIHRLGFAVTGGCVTIVIGISLLGVFVEQMIRYRTENALANVAATSLGILYLGVGGALILLIRGWGVKQLVLFLIAVKCTDIGAYFTGSGLGRHKIIPWLSPGKSWEGLIGGLVFAGLVTILAAWVLGPRPSVDLWKWGAFAVVVGLGGQFADLCESLLKRSAKLKDSGALVPEFGGVLDIIDSPLLAAPVGVIALSIMHLR